MSTRKPKSSLRASDEDQARWSLEEKRLQLVTIDEQPRKPAVRARLWSAEESASQEQATGFKKRQLH